MSAWVVFGAVLLSCAFPLTHLSWITTFALLPILYAWATRKPLVAAALGFAFGVIFFLINWRWMYEAAVSYESAGYYFVAAYAAAVQSLPLAITGFLSSVVARRSNVAWILLTPVMWIGAEVFRSSGDWGVPFGVIGTSQVDTPLGSIAAIFGVYGVSMLLVLFSCGLIALLMHRWVVPAIVCAAFCAVVTSPLAHESRSKMQQRGAAVAIVQGGEPGRSDVSAARIAEYSGLSAGLSNTPVRLIVWPEDSVQFSSLQDVDRARSALKALANRLGKVLLVGASGFDGTNYVNEAWNILPNGKIEVYVKQHRVPFSEFLPTRWLFDRLPLFRDVRDYAAGHTNSVFSLDGFLYTPFICYESGFQRLFASGDSAQAFVILSDDSWFSGSDGPEQHLELAQMRAIEEGAYVIVSGTTGPTALINPSGAIVARLPNRVAETLEARVGNRMRTPYSRYGDTLLAGFLMALSALGIVALYKRFLLKKPCGVSSVTEKELDLAQSVSEDLLVELPVPRDLCDG